MNDLSVIEVNAVLKLVNASRLSDQEITRLDKAGEDPQTLCGYYDTAAKTLGWRSDYDGDVKQQLDLLITIAATDQCAVVSPALSVPDVNIPIFAGGL